MAFGKTVAAEPLDLLEAVPGEIGRIAARHHAPDHLFLESADRAGIAEGRHGLAQAVRLIGGELRGLHGEPHRLFLEQRHAHGLAENLVQFVRGAVFRRRRGKGHRLLTVPSAQIGMHHIALDRAGPDDRHLDDEIVEVFRSQPRQHVDLRPALHLEHADGIALLQHGIDIGIFGRNIRKPVIQAFMLTQEIEGLADAGEHAERQHIDLHQPQFVDVVLVPFDEGAVLHGSIADRHHLVEPVACQHEAADMLGEVTRKA